MADCCDFERQWDDASPPQKCGCCCAGVGLVAFVIYLAIALEGVEPTEYAIIRNNISQNIDQKIVYESGLHWVGLFYSLVHFPSIHKSIEFSSDSNARYSPLSTRTAEGLDLKIHFSFQYQLRKESLPQMYQLLYTDYERIFSRVARNSVLSTAGKYNATNYWKDRTTIGTDMLTNLKLDLDALYTDITGFMLLEVDLPDMYEGAIVATEVTNQESITYDTMRDVNLTQQVSQNIKAAAFRDISNTNTKASSEAKMIINKGQGEVAKQNIDGVTSALAYVAKEMGIGKKDKKSLIEYFQYQKISQLRDDTANKLIVGKFTDVSILK